MKPDAQSVRRMREGFLGLGDCRLSDLRRLCERETVMSDWPHAAAVEKNVLLYDCDAIRRRSGDAETRREIMAEWREAFATGPGVIVLKRAEPDHAMLDRATALFFDLIAAQQRAGTGGGDHFAKPGANDRIWNSLQKHCLRDPANFAAYYANEMLAMASGSWLGPGYQVTAQVNCVNPGGAAQSPHRDYHLGFRTAQEMAHYPRHVHALSPVLTLQGAIAHGDAPLAAGPTLFLPYSQRYEPGYLAAGLPDFVEYFAARHVQLPLETGDMVFFNPALIHAAGANVTRDVRRLVNLFQVSSAFGRAMESIDRVAMCRALYPVLRRSTMTASGIGNAIAACADGYSFPTDLDRDPPLGGLAPKTQAALMREALAGDWDDERFFAALERQAVARLA